MSADAGVKPVSTRSLGGGINSVGTEALQVLPTSAYLERDGGRAGPGDQPQDENGESKREKDDEGPEQVDVDLLDGLGRLLQLLLLDGSDSRIPGHVPLLGGGTVPGWRSPGPLLDRVTIGIVGMGVGLARESLVLGLGVGRGRPDERSVERRVHGAEILRPVQLSGPELPGSPDVPRPPQLLGAAWGGRLAVEGVPGRALHVVGRVAGRGRRRGSQAQSIRVGGLVVSAHPPVPRHLDPT